MKRERRRCVRGSSGRNDPDSAPAQAPSMRVQREFLERRERNHCQRFLVRRREDDRRRDAGFEGLPPRGRAHAPAIARLQPGKSELGHRRDEVVPLSARELEERRGHLRADDVKAEVLRAGIAATVPKESGARRRRAWREDAAKHVAIIEAHLRALPSPSLNLTRDESTRAALRKRPCAWRALRKADQARISITGTCSESRASSA